MDRTMTLVRGYSPLALLLCAWLAGAVDASAQAMLPSDPPAAAQPRVTQYEFALDLPVTGKHIVAQARVRYAVAPLPDTLRLDLDQSMRVSSVTAGCDSTGVRTPFAHVASVLRIVPPSRDAGAQALCVTIVYDGEPLDGLIITTDSAGRWAAFGDNFPNRARYWLPTQDHPSRKAPVTFRIGAPASRTVVANGARVERTETTDGRAITVWRETRPIPTYGMIIAAAPLTEYPLGKTACGLAEDGGCVPQMVWTAPEQLGVLPGAFARAGDIVEFYARTVGAYPYEKLGHLQTTTRYGGMENPSAIFYFDRGFRRANGITDDLVAHETAHQWFGDGVTEREWAHVWLSEGFATFFAALWAQHAHGDSSYASHMAANRTAALNAAIVASHAVIDSVEPDPNRLLNENSYQKGGVVLRMLRDELGDSVFFSGLRRYYTAYQHGNALTQDLQRAMEDAARVPLGWFFDQWLRRPGWAELRTEFTWDAASGRVTLLAEQGQRFGAYQLSLPVEITEASGAIRRVMVLIAARASQSVAIPGQFTAAPRSVACDPSHTLLAVCTAK